MKRVLVVAHSFFETNMGAIRQRRIVRLLPRFGWHPVVVCATPPPVGATGDFVCATAPDLAQWYRRLRRTPSTASPAAHPAARDIRLTSLINRWFMIPDKQAPWRKAALRAARAQSENIDLIFASLEPRTNLLVAGRLSRDTGIPCVMEYRDLWTGSPYHSLAHPTPLHRALHRKLERSAIARATRLTAVARGLARYLEEQYGGLLRAPVALNYNFFDPAEYPSPDPASRGAFVLSYVGAMYMTRSPAVFFEGLRLFLDQQSISPGQFRFRWVGSSFSIGDMAAVFDRLQLRPYVDLVGQVPHDQALRELVNSDAALIIQSPDDVVHVPGKLFEALGARVPVLAVSHPCEVTEIVERTRAGLCAAHDPAAIAAALSQFWSHRRPWNFDETEREQFSADHAVSRLAALFDESCRARN